MSLMEPDPVGAGGGRGERLLTPTGGRAQTVMAVDKALRLLELMAGEGRGMGLVELSRGAKVDPSTAYRLLQTLSARGFVRQQERGGKYNLGLRAFEVGNAVTYIEQLRQLVRPSLHELTERSQETSNLAIRDGWDGIYVEQVPGPRFVRAFTEVGRRIPLYCTAVGKVLLAAMKPAEIEEFYRRRPLEAYSKNTITTPPALDSELARVREQGYAVDSEEFEAGAGCVAGPVRDRSGNVVASVSASGPVVRFEPAAVEMFISLVHEATGEISRRLGFAAAAPSQWPTG